MSAAPLSELAADLLRRLADGDRPEAAPGHSPEAVRRAYDELARAGLVRPQLHLHAGPLPVIGYALTHRGRDLLAAARPPDDPGPAVREQALAWVGEAVSAAVEEARVVWEAATDRQWRERARTRRLIRESRRLRRERAALGRPDEVTGQASG